jgi:site-specific DNA-methyltransferase (cytosine-N4-specific)
MDTGLKLTLKKYIQPFEKILAYRELSALAGIALDEFDLLEHGESVYSIQSNVSPEFLIGRLTYWESVHTDNLVAVTTQSLRESTVNLVRNGISIDALKLKLPFGDDVPLPNRRCLRYGTHGIHEYRGKFFPQLVRSLINIAGIQEGGTVADPMSGSGTTIVESLLAGCKGRGLDMNPLSVMLGNAKSKLLSADPTLLQQSYEQLRTELMATEPHNVSRRIYFKRLPHEDQAYLSTWFSEDVLDAMDDISMAIARLNDAYSRDLANVALSNIVRSVSWQKVEDLRVRKEVRLDLEIDPKKEFLEEIGRSVRAVLAFLFQNGSLGHSHFEIREGDARNCGVVWGEDSVDLVITSPPYATALPYLDTDRLSLCYLGLLPRPAHRSRDKSMIGNREVSEKIRREYWKLYLANKNGLPKSVVALIDTVEKLNDGTNVGFRRRNLPALLSKYFFDMKEVIEGMKLALKPGHCAFVVVGNNHTIAGGQRVEIQTAKLLQDIAESIGFEIAEPLQMDMLVSRDIFKGNAMASEEILVFRKPQTSMLSS